MKGVTMKSLWISAGLEVTTGKDIEQVKVALQHLAIATEQEPGCREFKVLQHKVEKKYFTLWECWQNEQALQDHFEQAHTQEYLALGFTSVTYIERLQHCDAKKGY